MHPPLPKGPSPHQIRLPHRQAPQTPSLEPTFSKRHRRILLRHIHFFTPTKMLPLNRLTQNPQKVLAQNHPPQTPSDDERCDIDRNWC